MTPQEGAWHITTSAVIHGLFLHLEQALSVPKPLSEGISDSGVFQMIVLQPIKYRIWNGQNIIIKVIQHHNN